MLAADVLLYAPLNEHVAKLRDDKAPIQMMFFEPDEPSDGVVLVLNPSGVKAIVAYVNDRLQLSGAALQVVRDSKPFDAEVVIAEAMVAFAHLVHTLPMNMETRGPTGDYVFDAGQWGVYLGGDEHDGMPPGTVSQELGLGVGMRRYKRVIEWRAHPRFSWLMPQSFWCIGSPPSHHCVPLWLINLRHGHTEDAAVLATCVRGKESDFANSRAEALLESANEYCHEAYDHGNNERPPTDDRFLHSPK